ncbi:MAG: uncharacterized protein OJF60_000122 [Burkholderiaceae bacterium]|jgi:osmotically-inducible protein OsmY|nr:MAG: uncharacterized protein OJF60_000122 [Burkholderiaceae bacterium]
MKGFDTKRAALVAALGISALTGLTGCFPIVATTAATTALVATDRRTAGAQLDDQRIEFRANRLIGDSPLQPWHVDVTSYDRRALLTGEVPNEAAKQQAGQIVSGIENVRSVANELQIGPNASLSERSQDTVITGRIKASFVDARDLNANAFKVVTELGVVYMMGRVTQREADRAADIARSISGVKRVVTLFELISDADVSKPPSDTN